jgi:orotate phosphoribosyltransferase
MYIRPLLTHKTRNAIAQRLLKGIRKKCPNLKEIDFIAVMGFSGVIPATYISDALKIPILIIRKTAESAHGDILEACNYPDNASFIIIDDGICTGKTIIKILHTIKEEYDWKCKAVFLYNQKKIRRELYENKVLWNRMISQVNSDAIWKFPVYVV